MRTDGTALPANSDSVDVNIDDLVQLSENGRYVAFSVSHPLQADDTNGSFDVYLRDRTAGTTTRVSVTDAEAQLTGGGVTGGGRFCGMSDDARYVGFFGRATNLAGGLGGQIYLRDRVLGTTEMISVSTGNSMSGSVANGGIDLTQPCSVSANGRYVAFTSTASNLVNGDSNNATDVFRRDRSGMVTVRASVSATGTQAAGASRSPSMSDDGNLIAFESPGALVPTDTNGTIDVFVRDVSAKSVLRSSTRSGGIQVDDDSGRPAISGNGQFVVFDSGSPDLVLDDDDGVGDVFVWNRTTGVTDLVSYAPNGTLGDGHSAHATITDDGRYVGFSSNATNFYPVDTNGNYDAFRRDRTTGALDLVSRTSGIANGDHYSGLGTSISNDGSAAAFISASSNLVRNDGNDHWDVFVRDFATELTPFGGAQAFAKQQFTDFEGRSPNAAELTEWTARITNGELSPDGVIDAFAHQSAWAGKRAPLTRLYWAFFLRTPDLSGMNYWVGRLTAGKSLASVAKQFAASSEFQTKYGSKTNQQFVTLIYQNIFERQPDAEGLAFWTKRLDNQTKTRGDVMVNFSESSEGKRFLAPQTDVVLIWLGMMRSMPTGALFTASVANLKAGTPPETFAESVRNQPEYAARVTS